MRFHSRDTFTSTSDRIFVELKCILWSLEALRVKKQRISECLSYTAVAKNSEVESKFKLPGGTSS